MNKKSSTGKSFFGGVAILSLSTVIVKAIGLFYKIPMMKYLGEEGMGYFNSAYEIYTLFYILATAGLPVAVSILVAENAEKDDTRGVRKIFHVSLLIFFILGAIGTAVLYFGSAELSMIIENSGALSCIAAISPMVMFICISSAVRGYFQGYQNMTPTAVSQIIEAAGKLLFGLGFAMWAIKNGYDVPYAAGLATLGLAIGTGLSMAYLLIAKGLERKKEKSRSETALKSGPIAKSIIKIAVPITISSTVMSLTRVIDLFMILRRLQTIGYTEEAANAIYGSYSTLAISMFNLPAAFVTPIALALVPVLASAINSGDKYKEINTLNSSLRLCGIITLPASLGLCVFSRPVLELVFRGQDSAINTAASLLSVLGASVFFSCIMTVTNAILQAYGKEKQPIVSMLAGSAVKIIFSYILIGIPEINVFGASISTFLCAMTVSLINFAYIKKCTKETDTPMKLFGGSLAAAVVSVAIGGGIYFTAELSYGRTSLLTVLSISAVIFVFGVLALKFGAIREEDITLLPCGDKVCNILKKIKLVNNKEKA